MSHRALPVVVYLVIGTVASSRASEERVPKFESDVRPILKAHCWHCHGEEPELQGGLDARLVRLLKQGGDSGAAVVPGQHEESLLYERIISGDMPPGKKKLTKTEVQTIVRWIDAGADTEQPEPESVSPENLLTEAERSHWSFQPISKPAVPAVQHADQVQSPIDAFLLRKLEPHQLAFSDPANRETLIRRVYFDLIGLPPSPEAVDAFVRAESGDAWSALVEDLLASPQYGERWGRHWLDVVGYADSNGYSEKDSERPWAFKYRDYVVRSFNADKPWNQFLTEQIAGDELLTPPYENLTPDQADCLTATGFLRMIPDGTGDGGVDQNPARNDVMAETIKMFSTSVLGLTVGCAQCHQHRYDPITQADYYRLRAVFEPAYDWTNWRAPNARLVSLWSAETRAAAAAVDQELKQVSDQRTAELDQIVSDTFERELKKLPEDVQPAAREARDTAADKRSEEQKELIRRYPFLNVNRGSVYLYLPDRLNGFKKKWDEQTDAVKARRPAEDLVMCLTEVPGKVPVTKVFSRGDFQQPKEEVAPGELAILASDDLQIPENDPGMPTTGRRLAYAKHLTGGKHPLVARVLVNRFWMHHFGRGLVSTVGEFGMKGERPSHPELLDWLAADFMESGWSLKHLHRLILNSHVYLQVSTRTEQQEAVDPDNRLLARMPVRRLEAEVVRDALLAVSGRLVDRMYGPPIPVSPDEVGQFVLMKDNRDSAGRPSGRTESLGDEAFRRSLYAQVRRSMPLSILEPFDLPAMTPNCEQRPNSTNPSQSLLMMNNEFVLERARDTASRLNGVVTDSSPTDLVIQAWRLIFGREPQPNELAGGVEFLTTAAGTDKQPAQPDQKKSDSDSAADPALTQLCHALFCSNGFLYVD
ncbi:MAG: PSD1 domain-containing protein [Planctomycetaceae bacterium]|nr:PSD1 domain-containing protein [Planctomycetaceae bacterium]